MRYTLHHGDCLDVLKTLEDCSVDAIVTDPPYGLSFMGKRWDYDVPTEAVWVECLRVLKPGGHLLAFAGTRTQHRMAVRIEDAGFEIRDMIAWVYGSGFPKSLDVSKAIDKAAGAEREVVGVSSVTGARRSQTMNDGHKGTQRTYQNDEPVINNLTAPATEAAKQWEGWGTALKPALEPITLARKPLIGTVAANVLEHGTGGLNIDGCRVGDEDMTAQFDREWNQDGTFGNGKRASQGKLCAPGRWPANFIHDNSDEVLALLGEAARFYYSPKASRDDRDEGCGALEVKAVHRYGQGLGEGHDPNAPAMNRNPHPTVKPTDLMRYLCRLITPPGGIVLDPFAGSGSTGKAAMAEGFRFIGIEREAEYIEIARARISAEADKPRQLSLF
jgi:site-specific DNA-methyltransferase (adenine-specific)